MQIFINLNAEFLEWMHYSFIFSILGQFRYCFWKMGNLIVYWLSIPTIQILNSNFEPTQAIWIENPVLHLDEIFLNPILNDSLFNLNMQIFLNIFKNTSKYKCKFLNHDDLPELELQNYWRLVELISTWQILLI